MTNYKNNNKEAEYSNLKCYNGYLKVRLNYKVTIMSKLRWTFFVYCLLYYPETTHWLVDTCTLSYFCMPDNIGQTTSAP